MKRRQFLKGIAAVAAVLVAPFKRDEWTVSWWDKYAAGARHMDQLRVVGRPPGLHIIDFEEIEKRVAAQIIRDGEYHQYAYNSDGAVFVDGKRA